MRDFTYSIGRVLAYTLPFIVVGLFAAVSQSGGGRLIGVVGCIMAVGGLVFGLRLRIRCLDSGVEVRYLQRAHRFEAGSTVEKGEVVLPLFALGDPHTQGQRPEDPIHIVGILPAIDAPSGYNRCCKGARST